MKLRIPLFFFTLGFVSGMVQKFPGIFLFQDNSFLNSLQFFVMLGILIYIFEKTGLNDKKIHMAIGILVMMIGFTFDYFMR